MMSKYYMFNEIVETLGGTFDTRGSSYVQNMSTVYKQKTLNNMYHNLLHNYFYDKEHLYLNNSSISLVNSDFINTCKIDREAYISTDYGILIPTALTSFLYLVQDSELKNGEYKHLCKTFKPEYRSRSYSNPVDKQSFVFVSVSNSVEESILRCGQYVKELLSEFQLSPIFDNIGKSVDVSIKTDLTSYPQFIGKIQTVDQDVICNLNITSPDDTNLYIAYFALDNVFKLFIRIVEHMYNSSPECFVEYAKTA